MEKLTKIYEEVLDDFKKMRSGRIRRQVRNVLKLMDLGRGERILEIGVATGKFTSVISRDNKVIALDILKDNLTRALKTVSELGNSGNLSLVNADCAKMPFADSVFDKVLAIDLIEHIKDDTFRSLCKEAYRVVKEGGLFAIYTPNLLHPYELARPFRPVLRKEHIGVRTRAKICRFLKDAGFSIDKSYFNNCFRRISIKARKEI